MNNNKGKSLIDIFNELKQINVTIAENFKNKYITNTPSTRDPLLDRMKFFVIAKRSAKMLKLINTTHQKYPNYWLIIIKKLNDRILEGIEFLSKFKSLNDKDQQVIKSHIKMMDYINNIVKLAELGFYVSASCFEAMVHEKESNDLFNLCVTILSTIEPLFAVKSNVIIIILYLTF